MQTTLKDEFKTEALGRNKPATAVVGITADLHFHLFNFFISVDIWTEDGYLITAVQRDGVTHHVRKGMSAGRAVLTPDTKLYHSPLTKAKQKEFEQYEAWYHSDK